MVRFWSVMLALVVASLVAVNVSAQEKKKGKMDMGARFDALEKAAGHDTLTGELTKDEFVKGMKASGSKMADRAEEIFGKFKKADENKITKDEFVAGMKEMFSHKKKKADQ